MSFLAGHDVPAGQQRRDRLGDEIERHAVVDCGVAQSSHRAGLDEFDRETVVGGDRVSVYRRPRHRDLVVVVGDVGQFDVVVALEHAHAPPWDSGNAG